MSGEYPRVSDILRAGGFCDFSFVREDVMVAAISLGNNVHAATALDDKYDLIESSVTDGLRPYLEAWRKFKKDYGAFFKKNQIEVSLVSKKWGFRGTPDRLPVKIGKKRILVDIKTSSVMLPHVALQTAGYEILCAERGLKINERWGIQLRGDGKYKVERYDNPMDRRIFIGALQGCVWKKIHLTKKEI